MKTDRLRKLNSILTTSGLDAIALNPGSALFYLTGLDFHLMERPVVLLVTANSAPIIILPGFESGRLEDSPIKYKVYTYGDNPQTWEEAFNRACQSIDLKNKKIGVEPTRLRFLELSFLQNAMPGTGFVDGASWLEKLRLCKDTDEISAMRKAVEIAETAFKATIPLIEAGISEKELAAELSIQMLRAGSGPDFPFHPIVSSGPNSANPHAAPSSRTISSGDLVVIDWGAAYQGYFSDLTRTLAVGKVDDELIQIAKIVLQANTAARQKAGPGIPAGQVDQAARDVIVKAGYGDFFTHRTGHGLGLEAHEPPYLFSENQVALEVGNTHSIEPGIYLPGRGGVRIEDDIVITSNGAESLSNLPRELWFIK
jgi:Xaa-Pro dipeptidase